MRSSMSAGVIPVVVAVKRSILGSSDCANTRPAAASDAAAARAARLLHMTVRPHREDRLLPFGSMRRRRRDPLPGFEPGDRRGVVRRHLDAEHDMAVLLG